MSARTKRRIRQLETTPKDEFLAPIPNHIFKKHNQLAKKHGIHAPRIYDHLISQGITEKQAEKALQKIDCKKWKTLNQLEQLAEKMKAKK